ncbi:cytochrome P450 [Pisolithus marmoratus]|nr:cytochrome P450 [Pisolithus marmoratus]
MPSSMTWTIVFKEPAPRWLMISAYLFPIPLAMICDVLYTQLRHRREAARRGAVLAPQVKSNWPGGFDILLSIAREFRKGHIARIGLVTSIYSEKHAEDALNQAKARLQEGFPVDFQDMVYRFTLDSATEFLFREKCPLALRWIANVFARALSEAQSQTMLRSNYGPSWRLAEFWSDRIRKEMEVCHRFIDPIIKDALETKRMMKEGDQYTGQVCTEEKEDLEDTLLGHLNLTVIRDEIINILIAGRDTTASTLTSLIYMLSQYPDVLKRLRSEVLSRVGSSRRPTYDDVREMKYMRAVINETLRLYPSIPLNVRLDSTAEGLNMWPGVNGGPPIYIPPKTQTPYSVLLMHRRKDLWGPDADIFDPDRFLDERLKYLTSNPFIFLPFNAGPRICLGQQFAYNEMSFFLVRLLQTFSSVTLAEDVQTRPAEAAQGTDPKLQEKVIFRRHITLYVEEGLWVTGEADEAIDK